jgi:hypothetical protein
METCPKCGGTRLRVRKSRTLTVTTLDIGTFRAHETILFCPRCGTDYGCDELLKLKPPRSRFGYDVLVYVGTAVFSECRNEKEIQHQLERRRVVISRREISYLAQKFIIYLSLAHRQSQGAIKKLLDANGGYILHLDATCEGDSPHLMSGLDGITEIVLENTKLFSEKADLIIPFLRRIKALYGTPRALVHDMGKGICTAVSSVFAGIPDFICHYHFLADIGKDLLGTDYDKIRNRLSKHGIQGKLHKRVREWAEDIQENPALVQSLVDGVTEGRLPPSAIDLLPTLTAYTLVLWTLAGKTEGDGYGFPFDRPHLVFYERLTVLSSILTKLNGMHLTVRKKNLRPYSTILRDLLDTLEDPTLRAVASQVREKTAVFDKLRDAMRLALPRGKHGLNDRGSTESMSTIEKRVTTFYQVLCSDPTLAKNDIYRTMRVQLEQYWDKLFSDPLVLQTPKGRMTIQPQRTNNILEQFFRSWKRLFRKKSGTRPLCKTMKAMIANTPLVRNLENPAYVDIILDGKPSMVARFAEIDAHIVRQELRNVRMTPEKVPAEIKKLIKLPGLPDTLVALFTV